MLESGQFHRLPPVSASAIGGEVSRVPGVLGLLGFVGLAVGATGLLRGGVASVGLSGRKQAAWVVVASVVVISLGGALEPAPADPAPAANVVRSAAPQPLVRIPEVVPTEAPVFSPATPVVPSAATTEPEAVRAADEEPSSPFGPLLAMAAGGDGDSWRDTQGVEYRLGLVDTPEANQCGGATATAYRKRVLRGGFRARSYTSDSYGRQVAVIYTASGTNLNVLMAREGIASDRYLAQYRHENPPLARELDAAFAQAKASKAGIWGSCASGGATSSSRPPSQRPAASAAPASSCHPDYRTCIPVKGDGSGRGDANDLDCGDIRKVVYLRTPGQDPYRLDNDGDGVGCESYG